MLHPSLQLMWDRSFCLCMMICYVRMIHNDGEDKNMTDDELKELVASLAVDSKNLHEAQRAIDLIIKNQLSSV